MGKIFHSLRFQLSAIVLGVFLGILVLLMLFLHRTDDILIKTRQLSQLGEISDCVGNWFGDLSAARKARAEFVASGRKTSWINFQEALADIEVKYREIDVGQNSGLTSPGKLRAAYADSREYLEEMNAFASGQSVAPAVEAAGSAPQRKPDAAVDSLFQNREQKLREDLREVRAAITLERKGKLRSLQDSMTTARRRFIGLLLLTLAAVGYVAIVCKTKIVDPMKALKHGATEIGHGALGYQVEVKARNEIGQLARVFNWMSVQLDQKQKSELRLKRLEAIEQIVRSVNHEINNPLMVISGNAEYLLAILESQGEGVESKLNSILNEVQRIFNVTQKLKEIKEPIVANYLGEQNTMIDIVRSSQAVESPVVAESGA